jgi:hypothetical protein
VKINFQNNNIPKKILSIFYINAEKHFLVILDNRTLAFYNFYKSYGKKNQEYQENYY